MLKENCLLHMLKAVFYQTANVKFVLMLGWKQDYQHLATALRSGKENALYFIRHHNHLLPDSFLTLWNAILQ